MAQDKKDTVSQIPPPPQEVISSYRIKTFLSWRAPERVFKPRNKEYWTTILSIALLISIILFFAKEYFLIAVIFALIFLYYVLSTRPPVEVDYRITNQGVTWGEQKYAWSVFNYFFISQDGQEKVLNINTTLNFPKRLIMPLGKQDEKDNQHPTFNLFFHIHCQRNREFRRQPGCSYAFAIICG